SCAPFVVQSEVRHEARSNRCRKRKHFGCDRWGGNGECKVLSALRPCSNRYLASLYPPKPRLGSPRGRSVHYSVFRPKQSGSHSRGEPWLKSSRPAHVKKDGPLPTYALVLLKRDLSLASERAISARRRHVPGPAFPVACSGVRIWRAEPIDARHGRAALLERGIATVNRSVQAGAVIRAPTAVSTSTPGGGQGQNNQGDQNERDPAHDFLLDCSTPDPIFTLADFAFSACTH